MLLLTKFRDSTFCWTFEAYVYGPYTKTEAIAIGQWMFKMSKNQMETGFKLLDQGYDIVTYKNLQFHGMQKVDYTEMTKV